MKRALVLAAAAAAVATALVPVTAHAQGGVNGSVIGHVYDQTGLPLAGVKVTARSDTQIGGAKVVYSNDEGGFRIPGLLPGLFELRASAPRLKTVVQKDVRVGVSAPAEVDLIMEVETAVEEVKVVERAPIVSTTTAHVKEVYDEDFVDNLPLDIRTSIENFVGSSAAGAVDTGLARQPRIRGGNSNQNAFLVEGFYMNGQKVTHKALAAFEVQTAGYGAEHATAPGGVVTMVTKSGSNRFELDVNAFAEDSKLRLFTDALDSREREWIYYVNPNVSGPIIKDRLWYFVNVEARSDVEAHGEDPSGFFLPPPRRSYGNLRGSTKLTWQVAPRVKLQSLTLANRDLNRNMLEGFNIDRDAQQMRENFIYFTGLIGEALLRDDLVLRAQAGVSELQQETAPQLCEREPVDCDHLPAIVQTFPRELRYQNFDSHELRVQKRFQLVTQLEWFARSPALGEHGIKLKNDYFTEDWQSALSKPGDRVFRFLGTEPERMTEYFANDPRIEPARHGWFIRGSLSTRNALSLTDAWRLTRYLTFTPGASLVTARASNSAGEQPVGGTVLMPSMAAAWDATHDGRTVLRASFSSLADVDMGAIARHSLGSQVARECRYDEATAGYTRDCRFLGGSAGRTFGLPCGPSGVDTDGRSCRESLQVPRTWEYTTGVEREVAQGIGLGADVVYRLYTNPYEQRETNRIWNAAGTALAPTGGFRNGRSQSVSDMATPAEARRRYVAVTGTLGKREGALRVQASYTWSRQEGNVFDGNNNAFGNIPPRDVYLWGALPDDSRHNVQASLVYQVKPWLSSGLRYTYASGRPYSRTFRNDETGLSEDLRARVGEDPGQSRNDPGDDRPLRLPDLQVLNLQVRLNLRPLTGLALETYADLLNVLALRTTTSVDQMDGPGFAAPTGRQRPTQARLGVRFKY